MPVLKVCGGDVTDGPAVGDDISLLIDELVHDPVRRRSVQEAFALREVFALSTLCYACGVKRAESGAELRTAASMKKLAEVLYFCSEIRVEEKGGDGWPVVRPLVGERAEVCEVCLASRNVNDMALPEVAEACNTGLQLDVGGPFDAPG